MACTRAQGFEAGAPVRTVRELGPAIRAGVAAVEAGKCVLVDVRIVPDYTGFPHQ